MNIKHKDISFLAKLLLILNNSLGLIETEQVEAFQNLRNIVKKIKQELRKVEQQDFQQTFANFTPLLIEFFEFFFTRQDLFFNLISQFNWPAQGRRNFPSLSKLKKLYLDINRLMEKLFIHLKLFVGDLKDFDFQDDFLKDQGENEDYLPLFKFLFYFMITDLWINGEIKLNRSKKKLLYSELKKHAELFFAIVKIAGLLDIDNNTQNQLERNILILSRVLELELDHSPTFRIENVNDIFNV